MRAKGLQMVTDYRWLRFYMILHFLFTTAVITPTCSPTQRQCFNSSVCVEDSRFCDGHTDCPDGSDEGVGCLLDGCDQNNGGCSQVCTDIPEGVYVQEICFEFKV